MPHSAKYLLLLSQKSKVSILFETPTTKAVGSYFVTNSEPMALAVGALTIIGKSDNTNFWYSSISGQFITFDPKDKELSLM
jgi:hypothetical protein